jgi:hypothetical protein
MPATERARVLEQQGYSAAWQATRAELARGSATQRAIAATGEFRLAADGRVEVTGTAWQSLIQDGTVPAVPKQTTQLARLEFAGPPPIITGEPISTGIIIVGSILASIFRGLFGGGINAETAAALNGLRGALATVSDTLTRAAWQIARGVGRVLSALSAIWVRVIAPILRRVLELTERLARIVDRVLRKYFEVIERIRKVVLEWYDRFARPILLVIQRIRQVLAVLKFFRVPFARQLDDYLARIEATVIGVIQEALARINILGRWVNVILTGRLLIQDPVLINSLHEYSGSVVHLLANAMQRPLTPGELLALRQAPAPEPAGVAAARVESRMRFGRDWAMEARVGGILARAGRG